MQIDRITMCNTSTNSKSGFKRKYKILISFLPASNGRHQLSKGAKAVSFSLLIIMLMVSLYILQVFSF